MRDRTWKFGRTFAVIGTLFTALTMFGTGPAQAAETTTSISGAITVPAGVDTSLVEVVAVVDNAYEPHGSTKLNPDGSYELAGLPAGSYRLKFTGRSGALEQWYQNASWFPAAEAITLTDGQHLTGINATLVKGATISGTVTAPAGVTLSATKVYASGSDGSWPVAADGSYQVVGLPAGSHTLWFSGDGNALAQYYNNATSAETATAVTVTEGQDVTEINSTLVKGASISGTVTAAPGVALQATRVTATVPGERMWTGLTMVAADGSYQMTGLPTGQYKVEFRGFNNGALDQWYNNAASYDAALVVDVAESQDVTGIDAALVKAASISGAVTVPAGVDTSRVKVSVYVTGDPADPFHATSLAADGSYTLKGLASGSYKMEFSGADSGAPVQWYSDADSFDAATAIVLGTGEDLSGVDATLVKGASISGTVTVPAGVGVYRTTVSLYASDSQGVAVESVRMAPEDRTYTFQGLRAGSYRLEFSDRENEALTQWYENAETLETASVVTVADGQDVAGIDATLVMAADIGGRVTSSDGVDVTAVTVAAHSVASEGSTVHSPVSADGSYHFAGLPAGSYKLQFLGGSSGARDLWYDSATTEAGAAAVTVTAGQSVTGVDAFLTKALAPAPGSPKRLNDFNGDDNTDVIARDASGQLWQYPGTGTGDWFTRTDLGGGWNVMSAIVSAGDFNGDGNADVIARDSSGQLWLYPGTGTGDWSTRQNLGSGWNVMSSIVAPGDFNGDGRPDVIARDSSGELWLYPNNGAGDWSTRVDLGAGWNIMSSIVAPGDFDSDGKVDLIARDNSGELWLYPGNGQNEWLTRISLGAGWNTMSAITAPGDMDGDGRPDVIARDTTGELWLYPNNGAGDWSTRIDLGPGWNPMTAIL